jgi:hypothetical protein
MSIQVNSVSETSRFDVDAYVLTRHAGMRVQQRGVNREILGCLLDYGRHEPDRRGCNIVTFDGKSLKAMSNNGPLIENGRVTDSRNLYVVVNAEGVVITAGYRFRRVPRDLSLSSHRPGRRRSTRS